MSALGTGMNNTVYALAVSGTDVYAAGEFTTAGGVPANRVAKWNGAAWSALGSGIGNNTVTALAVSGTDVYAGGTFTQAGGSPVNKIAKWDGANWTSLGTGISAYVYAIAVNGPDVYVGGTISSAGGTPVGNIAKWDGTAWSALGSGVNNNVLSLTFSGGDLYVGGDFNTAGGSPANRIAKWNGSAWSTFGTGMNDSVQTLVVSGTDLYAGGQFSASGCKAAFGFARLTGLQWTAAADNDWHNPVNWSNNAVPGSGANVSIGSNDSSITSADVTVNDLNVANGKMLTVAAGRTLTVTGNLNLSGGSISGPGTVNVTNCDAFAVSGGSSSGFVSGPITRCVGENGSFNFPVGTGSVYAPVELFNVAGTSSFTVEPHGGAYSAAAEGLPAPRLQRWWQLTNNGITQADITFTYDDSEVGGDEGEYRVYRINGGNAEQVSGTLDTTRNQFTVAGISSFSPWTLAQSASTAADVEVMGRVVTQSGRGVRNVRMTLTDSSGNISSAITGPFGYYRFDGLTAGRLYLLNAMSKRYQLAESQRVIVPADNLLDIDFIALPR